MQFLDSLPQDNLVIADASILINIYASGFATDILQSLPSPAHVLDYVVEHEVLCYRDTNEQVTISLRPAIDRGLLELIRFDDDVRYLSEYLSLMSEIALHKKTVDEGEAKTFACAYTNKWLVATDDMTANKIIDAVRPNTISAITTPLIVEHFVRSTSAPHDIIVAIVRNIKARAKFTASKKDPLCEWWNAYLPI